MELSCFYCYCHTYSYKHIVICPLLVGLLEVGVQPGQLEVLLLSSFFPSSPTDGASTPDL